MKKNDNINYSLLKKYNCNPILYNIVRKFYKDSIKVEPSIKYNIVSKKYEMGRYTIPLFYDTHTLNDILEIYNEIIINKLINKKYILKCLDFIKDNFLNKGDLILGLDKNKFKIYSDRGNTIISMRFPEYKNKILNQVEYKYYDVNDRYKIEVLKYINIIYMMGIIPKKNNWRHVYKSINNNQTEYHISLITPIQSSLFPSEKIYLICVKEKEITFYIRPNY